MTDRIEQADRIFVETVDATAAADGPRGLPPLLFVHGGFANGRLSWSRQRAALAGATQLLIVDRRGHGRSPRDPKPYTIERDAGDLVAVMRTHCPGERVALVAHSYGALVAWETARRAPAAVHSLHLIEPAYLSLLPTDPHVRALAESTRRLHSEAPRLTDEALTARFFAAVAGEEAVRELRAKPVWNELVAEARRFAHEEFAAAYPADRVAQALPGVRLILYTGGRSHPALQRVARELHARIPGSALHAFPEAGHDVQRIGEPFNEALLSHLTGVQAPSRDGEAVES